VRTATIALNTIDQPDLPPDERTTVKQFVKSLSESIRLEGMLQKPGVKPSDVVPGRYEVLFGRNRLNAARLLGWSEAEVVVFEDEDETRQGILNDLATTSENLWRNPLKKEQSTVALQKWHSGRLRLIELDAQRAAKPGPAPPQATAAIESNGHAATPEPDPQPAPPRRAGRAATGREVGAMTGTSARYGQKKLRIASTLTPAEAKLCDEGKITEKMQYVLCTKFDAHDRGFLIVLMAGGKTFQDAKDILDAQKEGKPLPEPEPKAPAESEMDDQVWFETYCGAKSKVFRNPMTYVDDALLYRRIRGALKRFAQDKEVVAALAETEKHGPLRRLVRRIAKLSHPCDFMGCGQCGGTGSFQGKECSRCYGCCYELRSEG
jgi:hypothetical protein